MTMKPFSLNLHGRIVEFTTPQVMGILNTTPDSFHSPSRAYEAEAAMEAARLMIGEGADIIDVGGYSTRPGAAEVSLEEELRRVRLGVEAVRSISADIPVSVDTFRAEVARMAVTEWGADIINDISGGNLDPEMHSTVAELHVPYILMHMRGTPADMQTLTSYPDGVVAGVAAELSRPLERLRRMGVADIIIDPGFGFAKTLEQNYELLAGLPVLADLLECPILAGMSRKSMITRLCGIPSTEALPGTIALHTAAMLAGAAIVRVHDVKEAVQARDVTTMLLKHQ
jgi:dihydropteroate synthase